MNRGESSRNATTPGVRPWNGAAALFCALSVLAVPALSGCGHSPPACDLDAALKQRAGAGAVNCGRVASGAPSTATDQCIADQTARGAPFYARYDVQGIDSAVSLGVVRDTSGRSSVLLWDSDPSGGSQVGAQITETECGGDPPIQTTLTNPDAILPVGCAVAMPMSLLCSG